MNRRNHFGMMMVRRGDADGLVAGLTAPYPDTIRPALQILGIRPDVRRATGMYMMVLKNDVKFFADATVNIDPDAETLADTAIQVADAARTFEVAPRIAMISFSNFGSAPHPESQKVAAAVEIVRQRRPDLEIDGEMQADIAVEPEKLHELFPFSRLTDEANVLVFPSLAAGNAAYKVLAALGGATAVGPILLGRQQAGHRAAARRERRHHRQHDRLHGRPRHRPVDIIPRPATGRIMRLLQHLIGVDWVAARALAGRRAGEVDRRALERDERLLHRGGGDVGQRDLERLRHPGRDLGQRERRPLLVDADRELRGLVDHRCRVDDLADDARPLAGGRRGDVDDVEAARDRLPARGGRVDLVKDVGRELLARRAPRP